MATRYYANAPATTLASSCTSGATSIVVSSVVGLPSSFPYSLILDRSQAAEEVVEVTGAVGTTLTVSRGVDSTTAFAHSAAATVEHGISARDIREPNSHINDATLDHHTQYATTDGTRGSNVMRLVHNGTSYPSRPATWDGYVEWVGPTEPTVGVISGDTWVSTV